MSRLHVLAVGLLVSLLAAVIAISGPAAPASAQSCPGPFATVFTPAQMDAAISCYNDATTAGNYVITLAADLDYISASAAALVDARGAEPISQGGPGFSLRIEGGNNAIIGQGTDVFADGVIHVLAGAQTLNINQILIVNADGVGLLTRNSETNLTNSTINDFNLTGGGDTGIFADNAATDLFVTKSIIASSDNGIVLTNADLIVTDSTIIGSSDSGMELGTGANVAVTNSTITRSSGTGIDAQAGAQLNLTSTTITQSVGLGITVLGATVTVNSSIVEKGCSIGIVGANNFTSSSTCGGSSSLEAGFSGFASDNGCATATPTGCPSTVKLTANSSAIDGGPACANGATTDQRGMPRDIGSDCDAGSYEAPDMRRQFFVVPAANGARVGSVMASGDFNGDGFTDVAVAGGSQVVTLDGTGVGLDDWVGLAVGANAEALAVGDFDGDGLDDIAIGIPSNTVDALADAGEVVIQYGAGGVLTFNGNTDDVPPAAETGDRFGSALAAGDFDGDGFDDLAVGAEDEDVGSKADAGSVILFEGSSTGIVMTGSRWLTSDSPGVVGAVEPDDHFGGALTSGDFNGDGRDDLAVGVPGEDVGAKVDAGAVITFAGSTTGIDYSTSQWLSGDSFGVPGAAEPGDGFGAVLAAGDLTGNGFDELVVGAPTEAIGTRANAGAAIIFRGSFGGVQKSGSIFLHGGISGVPGAAETDDLFGSAFAIGDYDDDGRTDLIVGVPGESLGSTPAAGAVLVFHNTGAGVGPSGALWLDGRTAGMPGWGEANDEFGAALATGKVNSATHSLVIGMPGESFGSVAPGAFVEWVPN